MDEIFEKRLKRLVAPLLKRGRAGDWAHTLRTIEYARYLLQHEEGKEEIVIPSLYLHDIGWSKVNFLDFMHASPAYKRETMSVSLHMKYGATLAEEILENLDYDPEKSCTIVSIIAIHDEPDKVFAMENPSATLVVEADRLDRYGPESLHRFAAMFGQQYLRGEYRQQAEPLRRDGLNNWFKTKTACALAEKLARESGLFDRERRR